LAGAFVQGNPLHFHDASGRGYDFPVENALALDRVLAAPDLSRYTFEMASKSLG
jgi:hypothetical protein